MPHYAALRDYDFDFDTDDIRGAALQDSSGKTIGTVTDAIIEHETGGIHYLVASIGGREVLVPTERVLPSSDEDNLRTDLTASEAERLPAARESGVLKGGRSDIAKTRGTSDRETRDRQIRAKSESRDDYEGGPVAHREGSDHLITPEPQEMPPVTDNDDIDSANMTPHRIADKFGGVGQPITAPTGIPRGAGGSSDVGIGGGFEFRADQDQYPELSRGKRWDRFAQSLKTRHLERMRQSCNVCASKRAA
jgi:sporulation protein YlmC with PRC-barrel domain